MVINQVDIEGLAVLRKRKTPGKAGTGQGSHETICRPGPGPVRPIRRASPNPRGGPGRGRLSPTSSSYSLETWGEAQAEAYCDILDKALLAIQDNPQIGHGRPELSAGANETKRTPWASIEDGQSAACPSFQHSERVGWARPTDAGGTPRHRARALPILHVDKIERAASLPQGPGRRTCLSWPFYVYNLDISSQ